MVPPTLERMCKNVEFEFSNDRNNATPRAGGFL